MEKCLLVRHQALYAAPADIEGRSVRVWRMKQDRHIRVNLVEMTGELGLHQHPDAEHSLMLIEGRVRVQMAEEKFELEPGDFVSIPAGVPHKYWALTPVAKLVSMDAPYYDPAKTVALE